MEYTEEMLYGIASFEELLDFYGVSEEELHKEEEEEA